jgi:hypothetical protein
MGEFERGILQRGVHTVYCFGQEAEDKQLEEFLRSEGKAFELRSQEKGAVTIKPGDIRKIHTNFKDLRTGRGDSILIFLDPILNAQVKLQPLNTDAFNKGVFALEHRKPRTGELTSAGFTPFVIGNPIPEFRPGIDGVCEIRPDTVFGRVYRRKELIFNPDRIH